MRCPHCSSEICDEAVFCPACGQRVAGAQPAVGPTPGYDPAGPTPSDGAPKRSVARHVLIAAATVLVVAVVGIIGFLVWRNSQASALGNEQVLELIEGDLSREQIPEVAQEWGSGEPLVYVSTEVTDLSSAPDGSGMMIAQVESIYENSSALVTVTWEAAFSRVNDAWESRGYTWIAQSAEPVGPIPDEVLVAHVPTLMQRVDENPYVDAEGHEILLSELYVSGTQFAVVENCTGADGGTATLSIAAMSGIESYSGTLTATFMWDPSAGDWLLTGCTADEGAYATSYDGLIGTWRGTLVTTDGTGSTFNCYGGRVQPAVMTVESVDNTAGTMVVDISYLLHRHEHLEESDAETVSGDTYLTVSDVLVTLDPGDDFDLYESDNPISHKITLDVGENGGLRLLVETDFRGIWGGNTEYIARRIDTFELTKDAA